MKAPICATKQLALIKSIVSDWDDLSRRVFVLRKVYEFSGAEIAARTGMSDRDVFECLVGIASRLARSPLCPE
jgi:DNA-directed RNA polymerase specialized sigma24 family protein